ncbi:MAG: hypothetical protein ABL985_05980 [Casimicrobium sp.]
MVDVAIVDKTVATPPALAPIFAAAARRYQDGDASGSLAILLAAMDPQRTPSEVRRLKSATGAMLLELGEWRKAEELLSSAKVIAREIGDAAGALTVDQNISALLLAQWRYREVLERTAGVAFGEADTVTEVQDKRGLLLNRAAAAVALRSGSVGKVACTTVLTSLRLTTATPDMRSIMQTSIATHYLVRCHLFSGNTVDAQAVLYEIQAVPMSGLAHYHRELARAAVDAETGLYGVARDRLRALIDDTKTPRGVVRDACSILLRAEQLAGDSEAVLAVLERLAATVVAHRKHLLLDGLSMQEETAPALYNMHSARGANPSRDRLFAQMETIIRASEPDHLFQQRQFHSLIASRFAEFIGYGGVFAEEIRRGTISRNVGAFLHSGHEIQGAALAQTVRRIHLRDTLRIFEDVGIAPDSTEHKIASQQWERWDGAGTLGLRGPKVAREALLVGICAEYVDALLHGGLSLRSHREAILSLAKTCDHEFPDRMVMDFGIFVDALWKRGFEKGPSIRDAISILQMLDVDNFDSSITPT